MAEPIRVQKFIADAGVCSRRAAEALIAQGEVWINGQAATLGQKITPGVDKVTVGGKPVRTTAQPKITVAVHKPRGLVCSNDDPHHAATVFDLLPRVAQKFREGLRRIREAPPQLLACIFRLTAFAQTICALDLQPRFLGLPLLDLITACFTVLSLQIAQDCGVVIQRALTSPHFTL